ncbi:hypothetical protein PT974_09963 [Cladobotryum mycophilum]|uniref:DNA2/NAM7 helicase-like C-terminal domain-containing protein n=1 Tax=Cladobotryum mycophilum TaxID=491253 RepID=A0ABR0S8J1_9HYPO
MARGLFDFCHKEIYRDVPFRYGPSCDINLPHHAIGRELETCVQKAYPDIRPPPEGTFREIWIHCGGSQTFIDPVTLSRRSPDQVKIALDFLSTFVKKTRVDAAEISAIFFYRGSLEEFSRMRKQSEYEQALAKLPPACTVDSYQGHQGKIAAVIMGTSDFDPGFAAHKNRLNVALSPHTSGLIIFGDINIIREDKRKSARAKESDTMVLN